jgi:hypothetical protein
MFEKPRPTEAGIPAPKIAVTDVQTNNKTYFNSRPASQAVKRL